MSDKTRIKIIMLGNIEVGKTSIILRFVENSFTEGKSFNFDSKEKTLSVGGKTVQLLVTDTAGQERFRTLTSSYYRNADAIIIVYDITNKDSFADVEGYIKEGIRYGAATSEKIIVGNKRDRESERAVAISEGEALAQKHKYPFFETSAKSGESIDDLFITITKNVCGGNNQNVSIVDPTPKGGPGSCFCSI
eukprot:TRINITY_DN786_c0_g2_i1.p1 TRINITY_DN786_c0_g2~~TRINITY_DN786_c0_g2_i1.p1  ORF type:complete len:192 (-),score=59.53 TRINITY_DN786_c0_g2_i1:51-626(-)